jgi:hypothetical protein
MNIYFTQYAIFKVANIDIHTKYRIHLDIFYTQSHTAYIKTFL